MKHKAEIPTNPKQFNPNIPDDAFLLRRGSSNNDAGQLQAPPRTFIIRMEFQLNFGLLEDHKEL
jgi:hypothetical protein